MQFLKFCLLSLLFVFNQNVFSQENPLSSLTLEVGADSSNGKEAYLDLDTAMNSGMHVRWMSGGNKLDADSDSFETRSRSIGVSSDYNAFFVAGFDYDYWGSAETIETRTRRFKLATNIDDWFVQLSYEDRVTRFYLDGYFSLFLDYVEIDSTGTGIEISFYGLYPWTVTGLYIKYTYDNFANGRNINELAGNENVALVFSSATLGMATGLEEWSRFGDVGYSYDCGLIGISGTQSKSAVDGSLASTGSIYLIWEINRDWSTTFSWGKSGSDNSHEDVSFGRVAFNHRW